MIKTVLSEKGTKENPYLYEQMDMSITYPIGTYLIHKGHLLRIEPTNSTKINCQEGNCALRGSDCYDHVCCLACARSDKQEVTVVKV